MFHLSPIPFFFPLLFSFLLYFFLLFFFFFTWDPVSLLFHFSSSPHESFLFFHFFSKHLEERTHTRLSFFFFFKILEQKTTPTKKINLQRSDFEFQIQIQNLNFDSIFSINTPCWICKRGGRIFGRLPPIYFSFYLVLELRLANQKLSFILLFCQVRGGKSFFQLDLSYSLLHKRQ